MEYTVQELSRLAGVSTRTLRYYDEIGLLLPRRNEVGYRIYGQEELDRLQQILFYRELDFRLDEIQEIVTAPQFDRAQALKQHRKRLVAEQERLQRLVETVDKTIAWTERRINMKDQERFEGFKRNLVDENEKKYGEEIRAKYGDEVVDRSNQQVLNMTEEQYDEVTQLEQQLFATLAQAMKMGDPGSQLAQQAAELHKQWLTCYWTEYQPEAHAGLAQMYVDDVRFRAYYDQKQEGAAEFLRDAILIYTGQQK